MSPVLLRLRATLVALAGILAVALICRSVNASATIAAMALLLAVLLSGTYTQFAQAAVASLAAALCLDYFFIPPVGSINVRDLEGWSALAAFLVASLVATNLSQRLRRQRDQLLAQHREAERLHAFSRAMLFSEAQDVRRAIVNKCIELFDYREVALLESATGEVHRSPVDSQISEDALRRVALYGTLERNTATGVTIAPIALGNHIFGSLGLCGVDLPQSTIEGLSYTAAVGLAHAQAQDAGSRAEAVRKSEELKSVMIDALAHDLKTPLTAIDAATTMLLDPVGVEAQQRRELLDVIHEEARGLRRIMNEAIHLARIDAAKMRLEREAVNARDLVDEAVRALGERAGSHLIETDIPLNTASVLADRELIVQALKQLLDNAIKYSPSRARVMVSASEAPNGIVLISVRDQGPGLTELEQRHVFEKFYRGNQGRSAVQGTGMGLAIAKEIVEAHGGSANVESQVGQGSRFTIALPAAPVLADVEPQHA